MIYIHEVREHMLKPKPLPKAVKAPEQKPGRVGSILGQSKRYLPPLDRAPGLTPAQLEAMMDPDRPPEPKR